jgi:DNA-binding CsgD family transcriptional regulator
MAKSTQALSEYRTMMAQADKLAGKAAEEIRDKAREHLASLKSLATEYEELTGKTLPEYARKSGTSSRGSDGRSKTRLKPAYAGMTVREAITKALKGLKNGLGPAEVAEKIGGNKNTVSVAMSTMFKDGEIKRKGQGKYTL